MFSLSLIILLVSFTCVLHNWQLIGKWFSEKFCCKQEIWLNIAVTLSLLCMQQMLTLSWMSPIYSIFIVMIITDFIWLIIVQRFVWSALYQFFFVMSAISSYGHNILIDNKWFLQFFSNSLLDIIQYWISWQLVNTTVFVFKYTLFHFN